MLSMAVRNTNKLIREYSREEKIRLGRFFTKRDTAALMAGMPDLPDTPTVRVLDPGAGTGILSAAIIERLCQSGTCKEIRLTCYENDVRFLPRLRDNLERLRRRCRRFYKVRLAANVLEENYILAGRENYTISLYSKEAEVYDLILMNPPTELLPQNSPEMMCVTDLFGGATDLCYLFLAMAESSLAPGGQLVALLPTVFATSPQLSKLRNFLFSQNTPTHLHLFTTGNTAKPLKKNMVLCLRHTPPQKSDALLMSSSSDAGTPGKTVKLEPLPVSFVLRGTDRTLLLMYDPAELQIFLYMSSLKNSFPKMKLRMRTGLTLVSRYRNCLFDAPEQGLIPLLYPACLCEGRVSFPVTEKGTRTPLPGQYLSPAIPSLMQKNRNMLLIKRVPARCDKRRLVCGVYLASQLTPYKMISTHNKLNYIDREGEEMDASLLFGLHCFLSSGVCDLYIRILSKSSQVNARELSDLPLPESEILRRLGARLISAHVYTPEYCDRVIHEILHISVRR